MRRAVVTLANHKIKDISAISHPILKNYAKKVSADFIIISDFKINLGSFHWEKFQCYNLLDKYDRILILDSDVIIAPDCPNLFKIVPYNKIGVIFEDKYRHQKNRRWIIKECQKKLGEIGWRKGYINTGVMLCSRKHQKIFILNPNNLWDNPGLGYDDVQIGYNIHRCNFEVFELSFKFNHMSMFSEMGKNRFKSYIIHYAGTGFNSKMSRAEQMVIDYEKILRVPKFLRFFLDPINRLKLVLRGLYVYFN